MAIATGQLYTLRLYCQLQDQISVNVRHFEIGANVGGGLTEQECARKFSNKFAVLYRAVMSSQANFLGVQLNRLIANILGPGFTSQFGAGAGRLEAAPLPRQVCGLIQFQAEVGGRKSRGRMYFPFVCEGHISAEGHVEENLRNHLRVVGSTMAQPIILGDTASVTTTFNPIIYHRATQTFDGIVGYSVGNRWATQKRRGDFGRQNPIPFQS